MGVCTKERKGVTAEVLRATPCTNSLGGESGEQKHEGCGGRSACRREKVGFIGEKRQFFCDFGKRLDVVAGKSEVFSEVRQVQSAEPWRAEVWLASGWPCSLAQWRRQKCP